MSQVHIDIKYSLKVFCFCFFLPNCNVILTSSTISELGRKIKRKAISRTDIAFRTTVIKK